MGAPSHPPEVRAAVVAALMGGESVNATAERLGIPKGSVSYMKRLIPECAERLSIRELLILLVRENLLGQVAGARLLQDPEWMRNQNAGDLGTMLGIMHDKTMRMLEAMEPSAEATAIPPRDDGADSALTDGAA